MVERSNLWTFAFFVEKKIGYLAHELTLPAICAILNVYPMRSFAIFRAEGIDKMLKRGKKDAIYYIFGWPYGC